eukprot:g7974.t1
MEVPIAFIDTTLQNNARFDLAPDVLFLKNTARVRGGAVLVNGTNTTVEISSTFIRNKPKVKEVEYLLFLQKIETLSKVVL